MKLGVRLFFAFVLLTSAVACQPKKREPERPQAAQKTKRYGKSILSIELPIEPPPPQPDPASDSSQPLEGQNPPDPSESTRESTDEPAKEPTKEPTKKSPKEPTIEPTKEPRPSNPSETAPTPSLQTKVEPTPTPMPSLYQTPATEVQVNSCIESLCGPAAKNVGAFDAWDAYQGESAKFKRLWYGELASLVSQAATLGHETRLKSTERLSEVLKKNVVYQSSEIQPVKSLISFAKITGNFSEQMATLYKVTTVPHLKIEVDEKVLDETIASFPEPERQAARLLFDRVFRMLIEDAINNVGALDNPVTVRLRSRYPGLTPQEALKKDARILIERRKLLEERYGKFLVSRIFDGQGMVVLEKAAQAKDLTKWESEEYISLASTGDIFGQLTVDDLYSALVAVPMSVDEKIDELRQSSYVEDEIRKARSDSPEALTQRLSIMCRSAVAQTMNVDVSESQREKAETMIRAVKDAGKRVLPKFVSGEDRLSKLITAIDAAEFVMPEGAQDHLTRFRNRLNRGITRSQEELAELANPTSESDKILLLGAVFSTLLKKMNEEEGERHEVEEYCLGLQPSTISDYAVTSLGKISVSWFSVHHPDVGIGILAHELGHLISRELRLQSLLGSKDLERFDASLTCVANRNPYVLQPTPLTPFDNTTWSEEDWADHFSSLVLNELENTDSRWAGFARNMGCALTKDVGSFYTGNSPEPQENDPHSSGFMRLLFIGLDRGQLTPACQSFLDYGPQAGRQLQCQNAAL